MSLTTTPSPAGTRVAMARPALRWLASFVGFPLGGLAAMLLVGPVDSTVAAVLGGLVTGSVLGTAQAVALRADRRTAVRWVLATALGLTAGLTLGSGLVGFGTGLSDLALQGAVSGALVGLAQALAIRATRLRRVGALAAAWPAYLAGAWALGWTITTTSGVQVEDQFTVFGAAGAITVAVLTSVLPILLSRSTRR